MNGCSSRFRRVLHLGQRFMQPGRLWRLAELGDVGAGDEGAAGAGQNDRLHLGVGDGALDAIEDAPPDRSAYRVHRMLSDRDDADPAPRLTLDHFAPAPLPPYSINFA